MVSIATPRPATETTIADLWVHRGVNKPDDSRPAKYPLELRKNKNPAWLWLMPNSFSIVGNRGERMILETKLSRKIAVRKTTGPSCVRKDRASLAITILSEKLSFIATFDVSFALAGPGYRPPLSLAYTSTGPDANEASGVVQACIWSNEKPEVLDSDSSQQPRGAIALHWGLLK
jgi:hypothetical protein